jgi:hypothetical protein
VEGSARRSKSTTRSALTAEREPAQLEFTETMAGELRRVDDDRSLKASFTVRVFTPDLSTTSRGMRDEGGVFALRGETTIEGVGVAMPTEGTLTMRPKARRGSLIYDITFKGEDGQELRLYGQKHVGLSTILGGMTTLYSELMHTDDEQPFARGILRFDLADVLPWLATFRLRKKPPKRAASLQRRAGENPQATEAPQPDASLLN